MKGRIYVADDEKNIRDILMMFLKEEGYEVETFENGNDMLKKFQVIPSDLIILDIMMPGMDGYTVCREVRKHSDTPIILLTARDTDAVYIRGFSVGCDDYFTKPFSPIKLVMKVNNVFARLINKDYSPGKNKALSMGNVVIDPMKMESSCGGKELKLTALEFDLLYFMIENKDTAVSRDTLFKEVWGFEGQVNSRATDDTIKRLRKKLNDLGSTLTIKTVWGYGFKLEEEDR